MYDTPGFDRFASQVGDTCFLYSNLFGNLPLEQLHYAAWRRRRWSPSVFSSSGTWLQLRSLWQRGKTSGEGSSGWLNQYEIVMRISPPAGAYYRSMQCSRADSSRHLCQLVLETLTNAPSDVSRSVTT